MPTLGRLATAKIALALAGVVVFGAGVRWQSVTARWIGISLVAVAWILRFAKPRANAPAADPGQLPDDTR